MRRKIMLIITMVMLLSSITACGNSKEAEVQSNEEYNGPITDDIGKAMDIATAGEQGDNSDEAQQIILNAEQKGHLDNSEISWYYANNTLLISGNGDMPSNINRDNNGKVSTVVIQENGDAYLPELDQHGYWDSRIYSQVQKVIIGNNITSIGGYAFYECTNLTDVSISDSVTEINEYAFYGCKELKEISIPKNVIYIGSYAFYDSGCYETLYKEAQLSNDISIGNNAMYIKNGDSDIVFEKGITNIEDFEFWTNHDIRYVVIPDGVTSIGASAFSECENLISVTIPKSVTSIGDSAFMGCERLTSVELPEGLTSIEQNTFSNCYKLTDINIPGSVCNIGEHAFVGCDNLKSVTIQNGVTAIGYGAFAICNSLETINLPDSITSIGSDVFDGCGNINKISWNGHSYSTLDEFYSAFENAGNTVVFE